ncbi:MAG: hypothetical protein ACPGNT_11930, partial [Rhodospirillales bacterium]
MALRCSLMILAFVVFAQNAKAAEGKLIYWTAPGCPWCKLWDRDVGQSFHLTEEGRRLDLVR